MNSRTRLGLKTGSRLRRSRRRRRLWAVEQLEDRTLLAVAPGSDFASAIALNTPGDLRVGTITPDAPVYFQLTPATDSFLEARVHAVGTLTRLSLFDDQGRNLLVQSDGQSPTNTDDLIRLHLPADTGYLELQSLGGTGSYTLTSSLTPLSQSLQLAPPSLVPSFTPPSVVGDFNGDGRPDVAFAAIDSTFRPAVEVMLDSSDGTLTPQPPVALKAPQVIGISMVAGDFNGDGRADLAVGLTFSQSPTAIQILIGNGDGTFHRPTSVFPGVSRVSMPAISMASGDLNGDGRSDLVVAGYSAAGQNAAQVALSDRDGTFHLQAPLVLDCTPDALLVGDFTGDSRADLIVNGSPFLTIHDKVQVLTGNGDGTFRSSPPVDVGISFSPDSSWVVAGDFNGDGRRDLAISSDHSGVSPTTTLVTLLGNGNGTFRQEPPVTLNEAPYPNGVVAGDFNGDGRADLAIAEVSPSTVQIVLGSSDGTFQPLTPFNIVGVVTSLAAGDFNGDGRIDLATGGLDPANDLAVGVLPGNGDGKFHVQASEPLDVTVSSAVTSDFNGDHRTDIAVVGRATVSGQFVAEVELGDGSGAFDRQAPIPLAVEPDSVVVGDFNGDGRADLAIEGPGSPSTQPEIEILLGGGRATFSPQTPIYVTGAGGTTTLMAGDFNGDGRPDLAVIAQSGLDSTSTIEVLLGDGVGMFQPQAQIGIPLGLAPAGSLKNSVVVGDFNGDGRTDLALAGSTGVLESFALWVLLENSDGTLSPQLPLALALEPDLVVAGDFNGDGRLDLLTARGVLDTYNAARVLLGAGDGTFRPQNVRNGAITLPQVLVGDFNGDGRAELIGGDPDFLQSEGFFAFNILEATSRGTLFSQRHFLPGVLEQYETIRSPYNLASDFNGDGRPDLAVVGELGIQVALNSGAGEFIAAETPVDTVHDNPLVADPGDGSRDVFVVDQYGNILWRKGQPQAPGSFAPPITINSGVPSRDIAFVPESSGSLIVSVDLADDAVTLYRYQAGRFLVAGSLPTGRLPAQVVTGDVNGDGNTDLVVRDARDAAVAIFLGDGVGGFARQGDVPIGSGVSDIALADLDLDGQGRLDLVVTNQETGTVGVLPGQGDGRFGAEGVYPGGPGPYGFTADGPHKPASLDSTAGVAIGTFTRNGTAGVATVNPGTETLAVLLGLGQGALANPGISLLNTPGMVVRAGDFNGDGVSDLAVLGTSGMSVFLADGQGGFGPPTTYDTGPDPTGLTVADANSDGSVDVLVGNRFGDVLVLVGDGRGHFAPYHNLDGQVALAVASLDTTGQDTFAFSNQGLNQVSVQSGPNAEPLVLGDRSQGVLHPGAVALADLNGDGIPDLVVANGGGNDVLVYPGLGGGRYGAERTFAAGTDPVGITVADVNGDHIRDLVVANHGSNDVSILLGQGQGSGWTLTPLERLRTESGPTATVVRDVDSDGLPDLFVSNTSAGDVTLLKGVGSGFFNDVNPTTYRTGVNPGPLFVENFTGRPGQLDLVTLNAGSNDLSFVTNITGGNRVAQSIPSGGVFPIAAVAGELGGNGGGSDLLVANNVDGHLALFLGGANGLELAQTFEEPGLPNPTALVRDANGEIFADNEGEESAIAVLLGLGISPGSEVLSTGPGEEQVVLLQPLSPSSLALIATLLSVPAELAGEPESQSAEGGNQSEGQTGEETTTTGQNPLQATIAAAAGGTTTDSTSESSEAQGSAVATQGGAVTAALPNQAIRKDAAGGGSGEDEAAETRQPGDEAKSQAAPGRAPTTVSRFIAGLDAALAQARLQARLGPLWELLTQAEGSESPLRRLGARLACWPPIVVGLGSPALTLIVELARAAADHDHSERLTPPAVDSPARTGEALPSDRASTRETTMAEVSFSDVIAAATAITAVVWSHVPPIRLRVPRRGYRLGFRRAGHRGQK